MNLLNLPECIFNVDDTGFLLAPKPLKVITVKGKLLVYQKGTYSKMKITCLLAHNTMGQYINLVLVFPGKKNHEFLGHFYWHNPSAVICCSSNGWMDADLSKTWIKNVIEPLLIETSLIDH